MFISETEPIEVLKAALTSAEATRLRYELRHTIPDSSEFTKEISRRELINFYLQHSQFENLIGVLKTTNPTEKELISIFEKLESVCSYGLDCAVQFEQNQVPLFILPGSAHDQLFPLTKFYLGKILLEKQDTYSLITGCKFMNWVSSPQSSVSPTSSSANVGPNMLVYKLLPSAELSKIVPPSEEVKRDLIKPLDKNERDTFVPLADLLVELISMSDELLNSELYNSKKERLSSIISIYHASLTKFNYEAPKSFTIVKQAFEKIVANQKPTHSEYCQLLSILFPPSLIALMNIGLHALSVDFHLNRSMSISQNDRGKMQELNYLAQPLVRLSESGDDSYDLPPFYRFVLLLFTHPREMRQILSSTQMLFVDPFKDSGQKEAAYYAFFDELKRWRSLYATTGEISFLDRDQALLNTNLGVVEANELIDKSASNVPLGFTESYHFVTLASLSDKRTEEAIENLINLSGLQNIESDSVQADLLFYAIRKMFLGTKNQFSN